MPRPKKNPVTEMPIVEVRPIPGEPGNFENIDVEPVEIKTEGVRNRNNVVSIAPNTEALQNRDTSQIDTWMNELGITLF